MLQEEAGSPLHMTVNEQETNTNPASGIPSIVCEHF